MHEKVRANIRLLMAAKKIRHEKSLAHLADVEQSKLNRYLNGKTQDPGLEFLCKISDYLGVTLDQLTGRAALTTACEDTTPYCDHKVQEIGQVVRNLSEPMKDLVLATAIAALKSEGGPKT